MLQFFIHVFMFKLLNLRAVYKAQYKRIEGKLSKNLFFFYRTWNNAMICYSTFSTTVIMNMWSTCRVQFRETLQNYFDNCNLFHIKESMRLPQILVTFER